MTASSMVASESSLASDSTISTASLVPATTRSSEEFFNSSSVGLTFSAPLMKPTRAAPTGPMNGTPDKVSAAEARDHGHNVGIVLEVMRKHRRDDLRLVAITVGKQWTDRAVDQARDEGLLFRRAALALEIAARNAARREGLFLIIDRQGKEIDPGLGCLGRDDSGKNRGFAIGRDDGAVGLAGDLAGFEHELSPGPIEFLTMDFKHLASFLGDGEAQGQSKTARSCEN